MLWKNLALLPLTPATPVVDPPTEALQLRLHGIDFLNSPPSANWPNRVAGFTAPVAQNFGYTATSGSNGNGRVVLDGVNDYFTGGNIAKYDAFTLCATVSTSEAGSVYQTILDKSTTYTNRNFWLYIYQSFATFSYSTADGVQYLNTTLPIADGKEHTIIVTVSPTQATLYVDGVQLATKAITKAISVGTTYYQLGKSNDTARYFKGAIKNLLVYSKTLTAAEIAQTHAWMKS